MLFCKTYESEMALTESPVTRASLLLRLRNADDGAAWSEFIENYGSMLYRFVRSRGLQDADAADIVQDVFRRVGAAIGRLDYDKEKGGFRAWLFTITRNRLNSYFESQKRHGRVGNDTAQYEQLQQAVRGTDDMEQAWEYEHMRMLAGKAMMEVETKVEPMTWQAFRMTTVENLNANEAGKRLNMSPGAVYVAKSRVIAKLREVIKRLQAEEE
jgi:RNA polymerase sigma-70 factor (ECF subfamily)